MAEKTIKARIRCKIDTAENWKTNNPVLLVGELGIESDTKLIKVGDGTTSWISLPYLQYLPLSGGQLTGALKIASGSGNGILDSEGNNLLYTNNFGELYVVNPNGDEIHIGGSFGEDVYIGSSKIYSDINVTGRSFTYNDKGVAVTTDIPKTLNGKTFVADGDTTIYGTDITLASDNVGNLTDAIINVNARVDNLTTTVDGKADTSDIPTKLSQLSEDETHRVVTDTEKQTWNAKSDFDGDYNSLINKPTIPTKTSDLTNDSGFVDTSSEQTISGIKTFSNYIKASQLDSIEGKGLVRYKSVEGKSVFGNDSTANVLMGNADRPYYSKDGSDFNGVEIALKSDVPTATSQLTNDSNFATTSQIPDINGKVNYSDILQATGTNTDKCMSQNAVTTELNKKAGLSTNNAFTGNNKFTYLQYFNGGIMVSDSWTISIDASGNLQFIKQ